MSRPVAKVQVVVGAALLAVLAGSAAWRFHSRRAVPDPLPSAVPSPSAPVFHEQLDGSRYSNRDLGVTMTAPEGWTGTLGDRSQDRNPYEGLVVRMSPKAASEQGPAQTFVSVVKRSLGPSTPRDPVAYIAREVLTSEKIVTEAPAIVSLSGRRVGKVGFEVKSGQGALRVLQVVHLSKDQALILTATAPSGSFAEWREKFEKVFESLKLES